MTRAQECPDESWLLDRLRTGCSRGEIADECDVDEETVGGWIDRADVRLYREEDWLRERVEDHRTPAGIAVDCGVTERTVRRWMDRYDVDRPDPPTVEEMEAHLAERFDDPDGATKKERIVALLERFGDLAPKGRVVEAVGCSADYASRFHWSTDERRVVEHHRRSQESQSIHDRLRRSVLERDEHECVRCGEGATGDGDGGAEEDAGDLEIHHVVPGESSERNLATLCPDCHLAAHGGAYGDGVVYDSRDEFWEEWADAESSG